MAEDVEIIPANESEYHALLKKIGTELEQGRQQAAAAVNNAIVASYWKIGQHIVEYEQKGNEKAEYGSQLLKKLSSDLSARYGSGFGMSNVNKMRKMYLTYPILQTVSAKLSWSHYVELLESDNGRI